MGNEVPEVLEGALLNALDLLRRLESARRYLADAEATIFGSVFNLSFIDETLRDAALHIRTCQWLDVS